MSAQHCFFVMCSRAALDRNKISHGIVIALVAKRLHNSADSIGYTSFIAGNAERRDQLFEQFSFHNNLHSADLRQHK